MLRGLFKIMKEFNTSMKRRYMDKKKPIRLKLQEQIIMTEVYKSSGLLNIESEQAAYQRVIELEEKYEDRGLLL